MSIYFLLISSLDRHKHTHTKNTKKQSEVSLKQTTIRSCTGSYTTICSSQLAQLTLRKGNNYADSQAHSQAGSQTYRCLGWRNREVDVAVEVRFGVKVGDCLFWVFDQRQLLEWTTRRGKCLDARSVKHHPLGNKNKNNFTTGT